MRPVIISFSILASDSSSCGASSGSASSCFSLSSSVSAALSPPVNKDFSIFSCEEEDLLAQPQAAPLSFSPLHCSSFCNVHCICLDRISGCRTVMLRKLETALTTLTYLSHSDLTWHTWMQIASSPCFTTFLFFWSQASNSFVLNHSFARAAIWAFCNMYTKVHLTLGHVPGLSKYGEEHELMFKPCGFHSAGACCGVCHWLHIAKTRTCVVAD